MYIQVTESIFRREFEQCRPNQFSYEGLGALFEHLDFEDIELDVIAICCDYVEYESIEDYNGDYDEDHESHWDITETTAIEIDDTRFIIWQY